MLVCIRAAISGTSGGTADTQGRVTSTGSGHLAPTLTAWVCDSKLWGPPRLSLSKWHRRHIPKATLQTRQSCTELGEGKAEPLVQVLHGQAWLVKRDEKPANRILITFFKLQMGFREDATTVELQTWCVFSLVKAEFPAHLTLNKNDAYISIYYKNTNLLIFYREQAKNPTFWNTKQAGWLFFQRSS